MNTELYTVQIKKKIIVLIKKTPFIKKKYLQLRTMQLFSQFFVELSYKTSK